MFPSLNSLKISGADVLPLIEGGKGCCVTNGNTSGAWAEAGGIGTISGVNPDSYDSNGIIIPQTYFGKTRIERHQELINYAIEGGVQQAKIAHDIRKDNGRIHVNILWEMGGAETVLKGILEKSKGLVHGITCGAGMPYKLGDICASFGVYYYPIISSARAFKILYKRAYSRSAEWLGGVVYEDPWLAGGHNGLSNLEDPKVPQDPYPRCVELRKAMRSVGLDETPIVMAGGVWHLKDWVNWIDNKELGPIVFQFGLEKADGPGLIFLTLPLAFNDISGGYLFSGLFFILLAFAAITSALSLLEPSVAWMIENKNYSRTKSAIIIGLLIWTLGLLTIFSFNILSGFTFFKGTLFDNFDYLATNILLPVSGLLFTIFFINSGINFSGN